MRTYLSMNMVVLITVVVVVVAVVSWMCFRVLSSVSTLNFGGQHGILFEFQYVE